MIKIAIFNQKGGTGKTTSTVNIAGCLEKDMGKKVLVVDCDSQMNATNYLLTQRNGEHEYDLIHCLKHKKETKDAILQVKLFARKEFDTNIYVLPGSIKMDAMKINDCYSIRDVLKDVEEDYDYCLFDCPAHLSDITIAAFSCADYIIVPAFGDTDSLDGYDLLLNTVNQIRDSETNIGLKILGIFFNNTESIKALDNYIINGCRETMGEIVFDASIRRSSAIGQARYYGKPVNYYKQTSTAAKDFLRLTGEIMERIGR